MPGRRAACSNAIRAPNEWPSQTAASPTESSTAATWSSSRHGGSRGESPWPTRSGATTRYAGAIRPARRSKWRPLLVTPWRQTTGGASSSPHVWTWSRLTRALLAPAAGGSRARPRSRYRASGRSRFRSCRHGPRPPKGERGPLESRYRRSGHMSVTASCRMCDAMPMARRLGAAKIPTAVDGPPGRRRAAPRPHVSARSVSSDSGTISVRRVLVSLTSDQMTTPSVSIRNVPRIGAPFSSLKTP